MAQDYKLLALDKGDNFQDAHGNYWVTAQFEGIQTEVKWVVKDPMTVKEGNSYYGEIKTQTSKAGKEYLRFYRESKPDAGQSNFSGFTSSQPAQASGTSFGSSSKPAYQPRDDKATQESIARSVALKAAVDFWVGFPDSNPAPEMVEQVADRFLVWLQGGETPNPKVQTVPTSKPWQINGRDTAAKLWPSEHQVDPDAEAASLYATIASAEEFPEADLPPGVF